MPDMALSLPVTQAAIYHCAMLVREAWIAAAEAAQVPATYLAGLRQRNSIVWPLNGDSLAAEVVNLADDAHSIDEGRPSVHLPTAIRWGYTKGSKRTKQGRYYLTVPLTHRTRTMPRKVYAVARALQAGQRLTAGPTHGAAIHAPGLQPYQPQLAANVRPGYAHASIYEGMQRRTGGRGASYMTFRTLSQDSPGWTLPAKPGLHLAAHVQQATAGQVRAIIEQAVAQDLAAMVRARLGGR